MTWPYVYTAAFVWEDMNPRSDCGVHFGLPRLRLKGWKRYEAIRTIRYMENEPTMYTLDYHPYAQPEAVGYKGSYSVNGECVGFLTLDNRFVSLASCYGVDLSSTTEE